LSLGTRLGDALFAINIKAMDLISSIERLNDDAKLRALDVTQRASGSRPSAGQVSKFGKFIAGTGIVITLLQGPQAINEFPQQVQQLGGNVVELQQQMVTGFTHLAEDLAGSIDIPLSITPD
jgi:hypothetical protein